MSSIHVPHGAGQFWLPGKGLVPSHIRAAMKAVEEYDENLLIARNEHTGDWCVFMKRAEGDPFPVFGLGRELPPPEEIKRKLYMGDIRRRGAKIVDDVERNNARARERLAANSHEAAEEAAEVVEFAMRKLHATSHKKVVLNERVKK